MGDLLGHSAWHMGSLRLWFPEWVIQASLLSSAWQCMPSLSQLCQAGYGSPDGQFNPDKESGLPQT